jgi:hypothetical protein
MSDPDRRPELVCSDRGQHRPVVLLTWKGPVPVRDWWHRRVGANWLNWPRRPGQLGCPRNPRPKLEQIGVLLEIASGRPNSRLDLSQLSL